MSSDVSMFTLTVGNNHMKLMSAITLRLLNEKEYLQKFWDKPKRCHKFRTLTA